MSEEDTTATPLTESRRPRRAWRALALMGFLALFALVTVNLWLLNQTFERQRLANQEHLFWVVCQPGHSAEDRADALLKLLVLRNREWRSADLSGISLPGVNLAEAPLDFTDFRRSVFPRANFTGAFLNKAYLQLCDLTDATFIGADLAGADLYRANLANADLNRAKLPGARLQELTAHGAQFVVADMSGADLVMSDLTGANLSGANLEGTDLEGAILRQTNLSLARFAGANFADADFTDCNWWRARGFDAAAIAILKDQFPPTQGAPDKLRQDYQEWLDEIGAK